MISPDFREFFLGNVGASAAFIGLLFVALSISPGAKLRDESILLHRTLASNAYTALLDVFFISAYALIPGRNIGEAAVFLGAVGLLIHAQVVYYAAFREHKTNVMHWLQLIWSLLIYAVQVFLAIRLLQDPAQQPLVSMLAFWLLLIYAMGLGRAWQLLGERSLKPDRSQKGQENPAAGRKNRRDL